MLLFTQIELNEARNASSPFPIGFSSMIVDRDILEMEALCFSGHLLSLATFSRGSYDCRFLGALVPRNHFSVPRNRGAFSRSQNAPRKKVGVPRNIRPIPRNAKTIRKQPIDKASSKSRQPDIRRLFLSKVA
jgi:hypothetical protein